MPALLLCLPAWFPERGAFGEEQNRREGGRFGEGETPELLGEILVDAAWEQSRSSYAAVPYRGCTLSKGHSSVVAPLEKIP